VIYGGKAFVWLKFQSHIIV